jgi:hypothetical protein
MRDIDLNQFWPQYSPAKAPPGLPAGVPAASVVERPDDDLPYGPIIDGAPPLPSAASPRFDHEAAIQDALAAGVRGWAASADVTRDAGSMAPVATEGYEPAQLLLDLPAWNAGERTTTATTTAAVSTAPARVEKTAAAPVLRDMPPARKRRDFTPVLWGCAGFIVGALVWHTVGFWMFVSDVVLNANDPRARTLDAFLPSLAASAPAQKAMSRIPESAVIAAPGAFKHATAGAQFACVSLALDRSAGLTNAQSCKGSPADLRDAGFNRRTDRLALRPRLQDPVAWTDTTAVQVSEASAEPSAGASTQDLPPLADAELKLDID